MMVKEGFVEVGTKEALTLGWSNSKPKVTCRVAPKNLLLCFNSDSRTKSI